MKKLWRSIALLVIALALLSACGSSAQPDANNPNATIPAGAQEGDSKVALFSNDACAMTLESVGKDSAGDYCWTVSLENKTGNELVFSVDNVYVNECEADPCWAVKTPASQKTSSEISWAASTFAACGIQTVGRVDFTLTVYASGNPTNVLAQESVTIFPNGASAYQPAAFTADADDTVLANAAEVFFAATGCEPDGERGYTLHVYMEDRANAPLEFAIKNERINGQSCSTYWRHTLDAGRKGYDQIAWDTAEFARMEIFTVSKIEFDLIVTNADSGATVLEQHCVVTP